MPTSPIELSNLNITEPDPPHSIEDLFPSQNTVDVAGPPWKRALYAVLEKPASSSAAFIMHMFSTTLILISAVITILETVPAFHTIPSRLWFGAETSLVSLFTVEYIARLVAWSGTWQALFRWATSFYGIIDLLAILPYYIEIGMHQDTSSFFRFSILRTFRLLRVFRPFRNNNTILLTIEVMFLSFRRSQHALLALSFFVVMVLIVFSTLLYFIERGTWDQTIESFIDSDGDPSPFSSIPAAAWFVLVTITTVGYGEIVPHSFLGRLVTIPLLIFGLLLIALPTFVLGREFSYVWDTMSKHQAELYDEVVTPNSPVRQPRLSLEYLYRNRNTRRESSDLYNGNSLNPPSDLSKQISDLQSTVQAQGELIRRLLHEFENKGKGRSQDE